MKKLNPAILLLIIFFVGWVLYYGFKYVNTNKNKNIVNNEHANLITVSLAIPNQSFDNIKTSVNKNCLELLSEKTKVVTKGTGVNAYVLSINDQRADPDKKEYWAFYINNKPATVGAGSYQLQEGDKIVWKIEKY